MKFQLLKLLLPVFFSSALGVVEVLSRLFPSCSVDPCSSSFSPFGVDASFLENRPPPLSFQLPNLLLLAFRVIFEMKVGLTGVLSRDKLALVPDAVRSSVSDSKVETVAASELVSLDLRESGETVSVSPTFSLESFALVFSLPFSLRLLNKVVNDGAAGFSFGVEAWCDEAGRVPMGACKGRDGFLSGSTTSSSA
jgi:hypothetical protein